MRLATIISLVVSATLGVGALVVARLWLPEGKSGQGLAAATAPAQALVPVVAARTDIAFGVKLAAKDLTLIRLPKDAVPVGAYSSIEQVTALDGGAPVTLARLTAREPLLPSKLSGGGVKANVAAVIAPGMRAYTIKVTDVTGGGGHVTPGDRVDVLVAMERPTAGYQAEGSEKAMVSGAVLQNIRVLGMDLVADPAAVDKFIPKTATLEVSMDDAARLALASETGILSLALRRTGAMEIEDEKPTRTLDLGQPPPAQTVRRATAPRRTPTVAAPAVRVATESSLTLVQGSERTTVQVAADRQGGL
jgi:pilus assembly protein CpaB